MLVAFLAGLLWDGCRIILLLCVTSKSLRPEGEVGSLGNAIILKALETLAIWELEFLLTGLLLGYHFNKLLLHRIIELRLDTAGLIKILILRAESLLDGHVVVFVVNQRFPIVKKGLLREVLLPVFISIKTLIHLLVTE